ncbi:alpha/beta hydrolase [Clostridium beijerinckii]|uniref:Alpha/beta hydrolase family protein n=1 Tax=Clostridium beijerinckii TaxID=1520 RepID=A0A1S8RZ89_CLOBE|nr:alpha/beta fold hydrolase [Clostridium beijerinckii]NRY59270.1 alpha-beta hydrolase superfamily lysophospholipase [Clostridium beijerinckii]OOM58325.1 alpha/beta hydrolase family protein [Clostridium beijerinckii]
MDIRRQIIKGDGVEIPSIVLTPDDFKGVAIIVPGYGGSKDEELGLAYRVAEAGFKTFAIDFRGHGENGSHFDENIILDLEVVINHCKGFGKVVVIGHSLGGRIALISSSDYAIGISPALNTSFSESTMNLLITAREYRVNQKYKGIIKKVIKEIPVFEFKDDDKRAIIYGSRDIPEIISVCKNYKETAKNSSIVEIYNALHNDICTLEDTFKNIIKQLGRFFE